MLGQVQTINGVKQVVPLAAYNWEDIKLDIASDLGLSTNGYVSKGNIELGTSSSPKRIIAYPQSISWYQGRAYAKLAQPTYNYYSPLLSMKTTNGSWEMGVYEGNVLHFSYITDTDYNNNTNRQTADIYLNPDGTIGLLGGKIWIS